MSITTLHTFDTEYPADTVEWCPNEDCRAYFACGTYQLESNDIEPSSSSPQRCARKGTIIIFKYVKATNDLTEVFRLQTPAILDMKWLPTVDVDSDLKKAVTAPVLATANALGQINVYIFELERLEQRATATLGAEGENRLALSLDWDCPNTADCSPRLLASDSKGDITILKYTNENDSTHKLEKIAFWQAHDFEAWICAFDKWDSHRVYTGGDDSLLHVYDLRTYDRLLTNRSHNAGVTSLLSHPKREHLLLTGSYDQRLRIFDTRSMRRPLEEKNLEGGIWRIKCDPYQGDILLTACMYTNFSIVRMPLLGSGETSLKLLAVYNEHQSICYGADWKVGVCNGEGDEDEYKCLYMATCSFYDKRLCLSKFEIQE